MFLVILRFPYQKRDNETISCLQIGEQSKYLCTLALFSLFSEFGHKRSVQGSGKVIRKPFKMPYIGHALTLPLESEYEEHFTDQEIMLLTVDYGDTKSEVDESEPLRNDAVKRIKTKKMPETVEPTRPKDTTAEWSHFSKMKFLFMMIRWHFILFLAITCSFFSIFYYVFDSNQKELILRALSFCDDWKQMAFFLGIYISFAVKKVSDIISVGVYLKFVKINSV